ncbi:MAG: urea carboxylase-associated family protein [Pacificimonas sp.]
MHTLEPRTGTAFELARGQSLRITDPEGGQVSDLVAFNAKDHGESLSNGRTFDYLSRLYLRLGDALYSNRSNVLLTIVEDDVGTHDFLLSPCSAEMFRTLYGHQNPHRGCFGNLAAALQPFGIASDVIPTAFNCFMNVPIDGKTGTIEVLPPLSKAGDSITFRAEMDLVVAITACSAPLSNGGRCKSIAYEVLKKA